MDDSLRTTCPRCGARLKAPPGLAGKQVKCPRCGTVTRLPEPQAAGPAPPAAEPESIPAIATVVRANRALAGKPCPACGREVLLGDEVVQCPQCALPSHADCWEQRRGCAAPACAPRLQAAQPAPGLIPIQGQTKACPACAEQIPASANVCPYCMEPLDERGLAAHGLPAGFEGKVIRFIGSESWQFSIRGDELVGRGPGEVRVARSEAHHRVVLKKRGAFTHRNTLRITEADGKSRTFALDDLAVVIAESWLTGEPPAPRTCPEATDALICALVAPLCCIILGPVTLFKAVRARKMIQDNPRVFTGGGIALAALIMSVIEVIVLVLIIFVQIVQFATK